MAFSELTKSKLRLRVAYFVKFESWKSERLKRKTTGLKLTKKASYGNASKLKKTNILIIPR